MQDMKIEWQRPAKAIDVRSRAVLLENRSTRRRRMSQLSRQPVGDPPGRAASAVKQSVVNRIPRRVGLRGYGRPQIGLHTAGLNYLRQRLGQGSVTSIPEQRP